MLEKVTKSNVINIFVYSVHHYFLFRIIHLLNIGTVSDVLGKRSSTTNRNTEKDKRTVIPSETFSPDSGGSQNTNRSMMDRRMIGVITFTTVYRAFLFRSM